MRTINEARKHLTAAANALRTMRSARSFDQLEDAWDAFLIELNRVWTKAERVLEKHKEFRGWQSPYGAQRRSDPLLAYLHHARNAHEHTLQPSTARVGGSMGINPAHGNSLFVKNMVISGGQIVHYEGDPIVVTFTPSTVRPVAVVDRGVTYAPPSTHLGAPLAGTDAIALAQQGLAYYARFIDEAEKKFPT